MVAGLPQQVFLLLVLVTGATSGTVQRSEQSNWTTGSTRRVEAPAMRLSHSTTPKAETPDRTSSDGRNVANGFEETFLDKGITADLESPIYRNLHSSRAFSISNQKSFTKKSQNIKNSVGGSEEFDIEDDYYQHPENVGRNSYETSQTESKLKLEQSIDDGIENKDSFDSVAASESPSSTSSTLATFETFGRKDNPMTANSLHLKIDLDITISKSKIARNTVLKNGRKVEDALENPCKRKASKIVQLMKKSSQIEHKIINDRLVADQSSRSNYYKTVFDVSLDAGNMDTFKKIGEPSGRSISSSETARSFVDDRQKQKSKTSQKDHVVNDLADQLSGLNNHKAAMDGVLNAVEMMGSSKRIGNQSERPASSSETAKSVVDEQQKQKSKASQEERKIDGLPKKERLHLMEEDEISFFDIPPPHFLSAILMERPQENYAMGIDSSSGQYGKRNFDWLTSERIAIQVTSVPLTEVGFPKRYARDAETDQCEDFMINDDSKREFYSPNYPQNYPPNLNCIRTLEAEKGMLLKLDFRDRFELESMTPLNDNVKGECRFDFLEVRDGQYGFSNLLGIFCDKQFPPEIISKSRHLWLRFHSDDTIEYRGFKAVWSTVPRPTTSGIAPEQEPCLRNVTNHSDVIVSMEDVVKEQKNAERYKVALDCLWIITAPEDTRMQLTFDPFKLEKPNDCSANFLEVFDQRTDIPSRLKNFCGSMAETVHTTKNVVFIRFYLEPKAINGTFKSIVTVVRDKGSTDKPCRDDEYDCDDNTCIALSLKCNKRFNCRFLRDEDTTLCGTTDDQFDSSRVIIILVIFSLIMFGMCFAFVFNCVRKLIRDHRIIREHIRQSRENRLDEIGRKTTPCPISLSRTDLRVQGSESPSVEINSSKELIPSTLLAHEYTKELVLEMKYGNREADIHQSNNVSNATQERLQESTEELEMCDSSCQTRESLFESRLPVSSPFSTFGYRRDSEAQTGFSPRKNSKPDDHPHPPPRHQTYSNSPPSRHPVSEQCSVCLSSASREGSLVICPKHNPIPAPPGWSVHDPPYAQPAEQSHAENTENSYKRYQSPDSYPIKNNHQHHHHHHGAGYRQNERYDSLMYGSARGSSNTTSNATSGSNPNGNQQSSTTYPQTDPRYRAEAVIEVDQKRPFSIDSTKSAPDVIATH